VPSLREHDDISALKVLLVISLILYLGTASFLGFVITGLQKTVGEQTRQIADLDHQISQMHDQISSLEGEIQNTTPSTTPSFSEVYDKVKDSVVVVQGKIVQETFFGEEYVGVQGSGFVCNYSGEIIVVTNDHVAGKALNITVSFLDGDTYPAKVIGRDPYSDLAILLTDTSLPEVEPVLITGSSNLRVGQPIVAMGNPFGLAGSMTTGVISQLGRTITESATGGYSIADVIQISAPINPGNSGGPLLNVLGEVIGITTAIVENSQGVGFAIPSDTILRELPHLIKGESYLHPWLGIRGIDVSFDIAKAMNLNVTYGWLTVEVLPSSPASKAGLRAGTDIVYVDGAGIKIGGDVIIEIDGTKIRNGDDLSMYLERNTEPGQDIQITVIRSGQKVNVTVSLGARPTTD